MTFAAQGTSINGSSKVIPSFKKYDTPKAQRIMYSYSALDSIVSPNTTLNPLKAMPNKMETSIYQTSLPGPVLKQLIPQAPKASCLKELGLKFSGSQACMLSAHHLNQENSKPLWVPKICEVPGRLLYFAPHASQASFAAAPLQVSMLQPVDGDA